MVNAFAIKCKIYFLLVQYESSKSAVRMKKYLCCNICGAVCFFLMPVVVLQMRILHVNYSCMQKTGYYTPKKLFFFFLRLEAKTMCGGLLSSI